ncbi:MAG: MarR family winged helix-turn-helix transcriptional regulator [Kineosporiaceae bacterium]
MTDDRSPGSWAPAGRPGELADALQSVLRLGARARPVLAQRLGISPTEVWAVEHLMIEPMGPVELARRLDMTSASATVLVRRLEATGHVAREPHPADRRRTVLRPTPTAVTAVVGHLRPFLEELDAAAAPLDADERRVVTDYLRRVETALARLVGDGARRD